MFEPITTLSKNKASVGDTIRIDNVIRTITQVTSDTVHTSNKKQYPRLMFNEWVRISKAIKTSKASIDAQVYNASDTMLIITRKAEEAYNKKWAKPVNNKPGRNTTTLPYIVLTDGKAIKLYLTPSTKANAYDLEMSFKSLHGTKYYAFAQGEYIKHEQQIILIGMHSFRDRNLSDKRKSFAIKSFKSEMQKANFPIPQYCESLQDLFAIPVVAPEQKLLSSTSEPAHWSGLKGDIAQDMVDQALNNELNQDWDYPF